MHTNCTLSSCADREIDTVWQKLTLSEKKEFEEVVKSGKIGHLITVYKPWWEVSQYCTNNDRE